MSFWYTEHFILAVLCHSNKINQPVRGETHSGDISINGAQPGFQRSVWEAEEQIWALISAVRYPQVPAQLL